MTDVFISYSREDRPIAQAMAELVVAMGYDVWWDVDLLPGQKFADEIKSIISKSSVAIVLWSERSTRSTFVTAESRMALKKGILVPVRLDDSDPPLPFNEIHTLNLVGWDGDQNDHRLQPLLAAIKQKAGDKEPVLAIAQVQEVLHRPDDEVAYWRSVSESRNPSIREYQAFLDRYGENAMFGDLARLRMDALRTEHRTRWWKRWPAKVISAATAIVLLVAAIMKLIPPNDPNADKYALIVITEPNSAIVQLVDSAEIYSPGVMVGAGAYKIRVSAEGFETVTKWHIHKEPASQLMVKLIAVEPITDISNTTEDQADASNTGTPIISPIDDDPEEIVAKPPSSNSSDVVAEFDEFEWLEELEAASTNSLLTNGKRCATMAGMINGSIINTVNNKCESGYCLPTASESRHLMTGWICVDRDINCALEGAGGSKHGVAYGTITQIDGVTMECIDSKDGGWAQFLPILSTSKFPRN